MALNFDVIVGFVSHRNEFAGGQYKVQNFYDSNLSMPEIEAYRGIWNHLETGSKVVCVLSAITIAVSLALIPLAPFAMIAVAILALALTFFALDRVFDASHQHAGWNAVEEGQDHSTRMNAVLWAINKDSQSNSECFSWATRFQMLVKF